MLPYLPFSRPTLDPQSIADVADTLASGWITSGPQVAAFEAALSRYFGNRLVRTTTSATAALEIALQIAGIGPGDEVITSAQTFFSVANMIQKVGATPVFVDCDLVTRNIDVPQVVAALTPRTRAIIPTHFAGLPADMNALLQVARQHKLRLIEDAALALGAAWQRRRIGSFGDLTTFSFHPNKNITTIEGGALVLNDPDEATRAERLRFHGIARLPDGTRDVEVVAGKSNLSDVSARLGLRQLSQLPAFLEKRKTLVDHYHRCLDTRPPCLPPARAHAGDPDGHAWNMFCVLLPLDQLTLTRKQCIDVMHENGIGLGVSYEALHLTTACRHLGYRAGRFPNAERIARETVTLPLFPTMTPGDVERVCATLGSVLSRHRR